MYIHCRIFMKWCVNLRSGRSGMRFKYESWMGEVCDGFHRKLMGLSITAANGFAEMDLGKDSRNTGSGKWI